MDLVFLDIFHPYTSNRVLGESPCSRGVGGHWQEWLPGSMHPVMHPPQGFWLAVALLAWQFMATAKETALLGCSVLVTENWPLLWFFSLCTLPWTSYMLFLVRLLLAPSSAVSLLLAQTELTGSLPPRGFSSSHFRSQSLSATRNHRDHVPLFLFSETSLASPSTLHYFPQWYWLYSPCSDL